MSMMELITGPQARVGEWQDTGLCFADSRMEVPQTHL